MSLLRRQIATLMVLTLLFAGSVYAVIPENGHIEKNCTVQSTKEEIRVSDSLSNVTIPYVDAHYGFADGIIDPTEYASKYTDPATGVTVYLEHNSSVLYVGLSAATTGWIGLSWKNETDDYAVDGLNNSDIIMGYAPGNPHTSIQRVIGSDTVTVHYILKLRNGTVLQEGDVPGDDSDTPISEDLLLEAYKEQIIGMRIGEVRHFVIPAEQGYNRPTEPLYGEDLEYIITLTRINDNFVNPASASEVVYSDRHGISTFQHLPDANQSQIISANASDDGTTTQLEYFIRMNSTDSEDIPILNGTDINYPLMLLLGGSAEDFEELPVQHTDWANPVMAEVVPNAAPTIIVESPENDAELSWTASVKLNISDNTYVRRTFYKINDEDWTEIHYNFQTDLWEYDVDLSSYENGDLTIWFNATDVSNVTSIVGVNITVNIPFIPLGGMKLSVDRTLYTELFHTVRIEDAFVVENNGSAPIGAIEVFLPKEWSSHFLSVSAADAEENELAVIELDDSEDMYHWRVYFISPVGFQEVYSVTLTTNLHSLSAVKDFDENIYDLTYLKYPVVPYFMSRARLFVEFRSGDSLEGVSPRFDETNILPMSVEEFTFSMTSYTPLIEATRKTTITVDNWGWLSYHEEITLDNIGPAKENDFPFKIPAYTTGITIYDEVGVLAESQRSADKEFNETVTMRVNLRNDRFGEDGLWPEYKYTFFVDYVVHTSSYQSADSLGNKIEFPMSTLGLVPVRTHIVDVVVPWGISTANTSGDYRLLYGVFENTLRYTAYNTTEVNPASLYIIYQSTVASVSRPLLFAVIFGLVAVLYVSYRRAGYVESLMGAETDETGVAETRVTGAPPDLLKKFANLYARKIALNLDLEKLEASRRRGKVTKKAFLIRQRDIKDELDEIDSELPDIREELISYGSRYRDMVSQLELQDEKIQGAKAGLRQLLIRKKKQRISRVAFEKSRQDYLKTIKKATTSTDRILLTIQEEAGEV